MGCEESAPFSFFSSVLYPILPPFSQGPSLESPKLSILAQFS